MKTTFDLPDLLLQQAKVLAAQQGRPLRDLVAEALGEKVAGTAEAARAGGERRAGWDRWKARLVQLPDGSWLNPEGVDDESFFRSLEEIRHEPWTFRDPFGT